jgi:hypothetical protein
MASRIKFFLIIHHVRHRGNRGSAPRGFSFIFPKKYGLAVDKILTAAYHRRDKITGSARWISEAGTRGVRRDCTWNGVPPPHRRFPVRNAVTAPRNLIKDFSTATACTILPQSGFLRISSGTAVPAGESAAPGCVFLFSNTVQGGAGIPRGMESRPAAKRMINRFPQRSFQ